MTDLDLLIDLHLRNDRQGPGGDDETRRAIELARLGSDRLLNIADMGCGTGASSLVLATSLDAHVTALDAAPPFIERLEARAAEAGLADRITARVGTMEDPPFDDGSLDLIWSEGAIYNIGFAEGVRAWRRLLRPGGVLAVTELCWTTAERPPDAASGWAAVYPAITTISANLRTLEDEGCAPTGCFVLPVRCWTENYFTPIDAGVEGFLARHGESEVARRVIAEHEDEVALVRSHGMWAAYVFFIASRPA